MRKKLIALFSVFFLVFSFAFFQPQTLNAGQDALGLNYVKDGQNGVALGDEDPRSMAAKIINIVLTLLSIIAVVIVLLGGFKWMTAAGNEEEVADAKKLLGAGVIGLVIILAAWGIASFALDELGTATGVDIQ
jgi:amino acid transporter